MELSLTKPKTFNLKHQRRNSKELTGDKGSNSKHTTLGENITYFTLNLILAHTWKN